MNPFGKSFSGVRRRFKLIVLCGAICGLMVLPAGCSSVFAPRPDRSRFFVLTPTTHGQSATMVRRSAPPVIGLGPITLPPYLDREEMVTRVAPNQVQISERDFWAAPLQKSFVEVLSEDLSTMLDGARIVAFPWYASTALDYAVAVSVTRFEGQANGALLTANWTVKDAVGANVVYHGQSNIVEPIGQGESAAAALSRALGTLSRQIATAIRTRHPPA
ncbi:MAG: PqiC family protein [Candidatus Binataceae bacterium]